MSVLSLVQFVRAKRRESCPVCALPEEIRKQLVTARDRKITLQLQLEWLNKHAGAPHITTEDLFAHRNGRHDVAAA